MILKIQNYQSHNCSNFSYHMRFLLISDTHGDLLEINSLAATKQCQAVIHAGDFGFYDEESPDNLTDREMKIRIRFSDLKASEKHRLLELQPKSRRSFVQSQWPLSDLPKYLNNEYRFDIPVYAVWGNHEDVSVLEKFQSKSYLIPNLNILYEKSAFHIQDIRIFGLGGNIITNKNFFQSPIAGKGGKVWSTIIQFIELIKKNIRSSQSKEHRILVSHVSPGKEPLVSLVGICLDADFIVSGHMDPIFPLCWNEFSIRECCESTDRIDQWLDEISSIASKLGKQEMMLVSELREIYWRKMEKFSSEKTRNQSPGWYKKMHYINLPDFGKGYAILEFDDGRCNLETFTQSIRNNLVK